MKIILNKVKKKKLIYFCIEFKTKEKLKKGSIMLQEENQVSGEASLELILKNVEDSWKTLDFILSPYKNTKDVFILGSTEEIQHNLDGCKISLEMIACSKYVESITVNILFILY